LVTASAETAVTFSLSGGNCHDSPEGEKLIRTVSVDYECFLLMDKAYEGDNMRKIAEEQGFTVVVPPKSNRKEPWKYDKEMYKRRNEIERFNLRIKRYRKVFTRYDKLDTSYIAVVFLAMIFDALVRTKLV
jgi:transposase